MPISLRPRKALLFLVPILALLVVFTGFVAFNSTTKAHAAGKVTLYVGHGPIGLNSGCASPGFNSVQTAVDVANPGAVVYLCGTTPYYEQVIIEKSITLTGDPGATIAAPDPFPATSPTRLPPQFTTDNLFVPQAIVIVWGSTANVKINNLIITGVMPGNGSCAEQEFGVLVIANGTATLNGDQVLNIRDSNPSLYGCQFGVGIQVGRQYWPTADFSNFLVENFVGHATIKNTTVAGYQKNGMTIDASSTTANISSSKVNGAGQTDTSLSPIIAQNGIQISRGASAQVIGNTVTGNAYTGRGAASSGGILVYGGSCDGPSTPLTTGIKIQNNTLQGNDVGVLISNLIYDNNNQCSLPTTPTNIAASSNHISNDAVTNVSGTNLFGYGGGYQAGISDEGYADRLTQNAICGIGYTPVPTPPPYLSQIDVAATNPIVSGNTTCTSSSTVKAPGNTQTVKKGHIRNISRPIK
jgi:hypothetical protein